MLPFWMATLVIKSVPESLHARLKAVAAKHRRSVTQETIKLLEDALNVESDESGESYWSNRTLVAEYEKELSEGAFSGGTDSTDVISEDRDSR